MNAIFTLVELIRPKSKKEVATYMDVIFILFSMIFFSIDFILDIILAINYFLEGHMRFLILTICVMFLPALILTVINIWWYDMQSHYDNSRTPTKLRKLRNVFIFLMMAPLLRNLEALYYAIKSIKKGEKVDKKSFYRKMIQFTAHAALLTLLEAVMECGPQVVLQLYIFMQSLASNPNVFTEDLQMLKIFISVMSMSFAYASYQRSSRLLLEDKGSVNIKKMIFFFVWRIFEVSSRVIALGLFAAVYPYYLLLFCFIHFLAMFCWVTSMKTYFFENKFRDFIYNLVFAEAYIFFFFNPKDDQTRKCYTIYYILVFLENMTLTFLWYFNYSPEVNRLLVIILQLSLFTLAVALMVTYLYSVYPSLKITTPKTVEEPPSDLKTQQMKMLYLYQ